jgi:uncharacterized protein YggE
MLKSGLVFLLVSFCSLAFGQLDSNSITVNASNTDNLQPDQAIFSVSVQAAAATSFDDILAALQGSGITAANFSGVNTAQQTLTCVGRPSETLILQWVFSLPAPLANTKATVATLTTLQQNIAKQNNGLALLFSLSGTQVSQQLAQTQTCSLAALIASATTQAQSLATASGLTLGSILAMSSSTSNFVSSPYASLPACAITVKFNASRN